MGQVIPGWNTNDHNLMRILSNFMLMSVDAHQQNVIANNKQKKIQDVIVFALDIMKVKTYKQLIRKLQLYCKPLLGFEAVTLFFVN